MGQIGRVGPSLKDPQGQKLGYCEADRRPGGTGMTRILTAALFVLTLSAPALAGTVPEGVKLRAYPPVGNGDPNAISCWAYRTTPPIRGLQCAPNSVWARLNNNVNGLYLGDGGPVGGVPCCAANNH